MKPVNVFTATALASGVGAYAVIKSQRGRCEHRDARSSALGRSALVRQLFLLSWPAVYASFSLLGVPVFDSPLMLTVFAAVLLFLAHKMLSGCAETPLDTKVDPSDAAQRQSTVLTNVGLLSGSVLGIGYLLNAAGHGTESKSASAPNSSAQSGPKLILVSLFAMMATTTVVKEVAVRENLLYLLFGTLAIGTLAWWH